MKLWAASMQTPREQVSCIKNTTTCGHGRELILYDPMSAPPLQQSYPILQESINALPLPEDTELSRQDFSFLNLIDNLLTFTHQIK